VRPTHPLRLRSITDLHLTETKIKAYLDKVAAEYRFGDASWYLYRLMLSRAEERLSEDYIEMMYAVLKSWGMNSRGARLAPYSDMKASILSSRSTIRKLSALRLEKVGSLRAGFVHETLRKLFDALVLVERGKPKFVTFAKTMHFLCPHLVAPMDRRYTLAFFRKNQTALPKGDRQFDLFIEIMEQYRELCLAFDLDKFVDRRWNLTLPKVCDNIIIGQSKLRSPTRT
jgi:hypothetical protein